MSNLKAEDLKKLRIVFLPKETAPKETSICMGLAKLLSEKGHNVVIVVDDLDSFSGSKDWASNIVFQVPKDKEEKKPEDGVTEGASLATDVSTPKKDNLDVNTVPDAKEYAQIAKLFTLNSALIKNWVQYLTNSVIELKRLVQSLSENNEQLEELANKYEPDIFVTDSPIEYYSINQTGNAWVWLYNGNPLPLLDDSKLPPPYTGLSDQIVKSGGMKLELSRLVYGTVKLLRNVVNLGLMFKGAKYRLVNFESPYLTIYGYPTELDYTDRTTWKSNFYRVDTFTPKTGLVSDVSKLPDGLKTKEGKLIYVTLGSFHSANNKFMRTLLDRLSKSSHKFLIDKQFTPEELQLSNNMLYPDKTWTKTEMTGASDLVISDGSNQSVIDAMSLGKPIIIIPFWLEQLDNAQRVHETGYGIRLSPWKYTEEEILGSIEKLLNDQIVNEKLTEASKRIVDEDRLDKAAELIENLGLDKNFYRDI